jgi:hypothetical protein
MNTSKPLAKSLHTVSVLVNLSRHLMLAGLSAPKALEQACIILDLADKPDVYDLKGQALKQLSK